MAHHYQMAIFVGLPLHACHSCLSLQDVDAIDSEDASVIRCLQDYIGEIKSDKCKQQVCGVV
jgi:hypothetical protein